VVAVAHAHSILRIVHHLLIDEHPFEDLGEAYFDQRQRQHVSRRLKQRLERLGYRVQLEALTSAA
jgi:transposase